MPQRGPGPDGWLGGSDDWWDLRGCDLAAHLRATPDLGENALHELLFKRVCFGDRDREKQPANLSYVSFKQSEFEHVTFVNTSLQGTYLRDCRFRACDFRYVHASRASFQDSRFHECDFYRALFETATVFTDVTFDRVSLDKAWLAGVAGLRKEMFGPTAMIQEGDEQAYLSFLEATIGDRPASHSVERALEQAKVDAAEVFRALSGMWSAQGQLRDAGFAYVRCKDLERDFFSPRRRLRVNRARAMRNAERDRLAHADALPAEDLALRNSQREPPLPNGLRELGTWLGLVAAWTTAGYGERMKRVAFWLLLVILIPGSIFSIFGGVQREGEPNETVHTWTKCILFSFQQLTDSVHQLQPANSLVELVGAAQFFVGVALLGLFGFTLANRLRNS